MPSFFGPPSLSFNNSSGPGTLAGRVHNATFSLDVTAPRGHRALRLQVSIRSDGRVRSYEDGAQLYRCTYLALDRSPLAPLVAGNCSQLPNGDIGIQVFHHTTPEAVDKIQSSKVLLSGPYNLAGTSKLENVAYTYFTTLSEIRDDNDLRRIAMSAGGSIAYQTTSERAVEDVLDLPVYRSTTADRTSSLTFEVPCEIIAPAHLLFHPFVDHNPPYFEIVGAEIIRVAVKPGAKLAFSEGKIMVDRTQLIGFDYVVEGNASSNAGLEAPMKEETTTQIAHLEKLDQGLDLFEFWQKHKNTDLFTGRSFEARKLLPPN